MADTIIYKGRGNAEMYDDYMDFINYVFGFNGNEQDFKKLLPISKAIIFMINPLIFISLYFNYTNFPAPGQWQSEAL